MSMVWIGLNEFSAKESLFFVVGRGPFTSQSQVLTSRRPSENIVGKGEHAGFFFSGDVFQPFRSKSYHLSHVFTWEQSKPLMFGKEFRLN